MAVSQSFGFINLDRQSDPALVFAGAVGALSDGGRQLYRWPR
jgi:hypothetical protein